MVVFIIVDTVQFVVVISLVQRSASFRGQFSSGCRALTCDAGTSGFVLRVGCCTCVGLIGCPAVKAVPVDVAGIRGAALRGEAAETVVIEVVGCAPAPPLMSGSVAR